MVTGEHGLHRVVIGVVAVVVAVVAVVVEIVVSIEAESSSMIVEKIPYYRPNFKSFPKIII